MPCKYYWILHSRFSLVSLGLTYLSPSLVICEAWIFYWGNVQVLDLRLIQTWLQLDKVCVEHVKNLKKKKIGCGQNMVKTRPGLL